MADNVGTGAYELSADRTQLKQDLASAATDIQASGTAAEKSFTAAVTPIGASFKKVGAEALTMGAHYKEATNTLIQQTGASGAALDGLKTSMGNVARQVPEDLDTVAQAVAGLNVKLDLTGPALDGASKSLLDFARLNRIDVTTAIDLVAGAMQRLNIPADQLPGLLDKATVAEEKTGIKATDLFNALAKVGPTLADMGFSVDGSIALLGAWDKAGGDTAQLATGMNKAFLAFAKEGATDGASALQILVDKIKAAPTDMAAAGIASEIFGKKVGVTMAQQIRAGTFDIGALTQQVHDSGGELDTVTERTKTWSERFHEFFNGISTAVGPAAADLGTITGAVSNLSGALSPLSGPLKNVGGLIVSAFKGLAAKVIPTAVYEGALIGEAEGGATAAGATGSKVLNSFLAKFGLMTGAKVIAAEGAGLLEGEAEGTAAAEAATGPGILAKFKDAGGLAGKAFGGALAIGAVIAVPALAADLGNKLYEAITGFFGGMSRDQLAHLGQPIGAGAAEGVVQGIETYGPPDPKLFIGPPNPFLTYAYQIGQDAGAAFPAGMSTSPFDISGLMEKLKQAAIDGADAAAKATADELAAALAAHAKAITDAAWGIGVATPREFAQGARSAFDTVHSAFSGLKDLMKTTLSPAAQEAELIGIATSKRLSKALTDGRPAVRGEAQQIALDTIAELQKLDPASTKIGELSTRLLAGALPNEKPALQAAINQILNTITTPLGTLPGIASTTGTQISSHLVSALHAGYDNVGNATNGLARIIESKLALFSPAKEGPWSKRGGPIAWMERAGKGMGMGLASSLLGTVPVVAAAADTLASSLSMGSQSLPSLAFASGPITQSTPSPGGGSSNGTGVTLNGGITVNVNGGITNEETGAAVEGAVLRVMEKVGRLRLNHQLDMSGKPA